MRPYLVYTSAGKHNNVKRWLQGRSRSYDLWVTNYSDSPGLLRDVADYYNERKGAKFPNFAHIVRNNREKLEQYEAIMIMDDDIIISPKKLERLFSQLLEQDLWIITPAFSRLGKLTHDTTERKIISQYRYTNFAEVTCPIFRTDKLLSFMDVYDSDLTCFGVDWWYLNFLNDTSHTKIVISDENYCINPRDFHKNTTTREIDKYISGEDRITHWEEKKKILGINSFKKNIYQSRQRPFYKVVAAFPLFVVEIIFDKALKSKFLMPLKKASKNLISTIKGRS